MSTTKVLILCSSRPAIMVRGDKVVQLCPDIGYRRLQIVFSRKTHLAEVDSRIAKYLTSIFDDVTLHTPEKEETPIPEKEETPIPVKEETPIPKKEKVVNDKGRDSTTNNT